MNETYYAKMPTVQVRSAGVNMLLSFLFSIFLSTISMTRRVAEKTLANGRYASNRETSRRSLGSLLAG
jgi:hypothetical protein